MGFPLSFLSLFSVLFVLPYVVHVLVPSSGKVNQKDVLVTGQVRKL